MHCFCAGILQSGWLLAIRCISHSLDQNGMHGLMHHHFLTSWIGAVRAGGGGAAPAAAEEEEEAEEDDEERAAWTPERRTAEQMVAALVEQWRKPMCGHTLAWEC